MSSCATVVVGVGNGENRPEKDLPGLPRKVSVAATFVGFRQDTHQSSFIYLYFNGNILASTARTLTNKAFVYSFKSGLSSPVRQNVGGET
jgi:hypothetical protein